MGLGFRGFRGLGGSGGAGSSGGLGGCRAEDFTSTLRDNTDPPENPKLEEVPMSF